MKWRPSLFIPGVILLVTFTLTAVASCLFGLKVGANQDGAAFEFGLRQDDAVAFYAFALCLAGVACIGLGMAARGIGRDLGSAASREAFLRGYGFVLVASCLAVLWGGTCEWPLDAFRCVMGWAGVALLARKLRERWRLARWLGAALVCALTWAFLRLRGSSPSTLQDQWPLYAVFIVGAVMVAAGARARPSLRRPGG